MIQVTQKNFKDEVVNFKGIVAADFFADWCGPCQMLSPLMEEMSRENKDEDVKFVKVNVDEEQELAGLFGVMSIPTVIVFNRGRVVNQQVGVASKTTYQNLIDQANVKPSDHIKDNDNQVIVFTTPTCPYCHMLKDYLRQKRVEFKEINVAQDGAWAKKMV